MTAAPTMLVMNASQTPIVPRWASTISRRLRRSSAPAPGTAAYVEECFTSIVFDRNWRDVSELKWPTTTTGMPFWNSCGGLPVLTTSTTWAPWHIEKSAPAAVEWIEPGTTLPSSRKFVVPSCARCESAWLIVSK